MERPTFSPFWHRLRATRPRLRAHVQVTRQRYRGRRWHVAHDPTSNQFYRLSPVAYDFVASLDGLRTVDQAWRLSLEKHGDKAPTQHEVIELIGQLYNSNLLSVDATPETEQLLRRGRERVRKRLVQQAISLMYFKIRLFNPDGLLTAVEPIFRPLINRWGLLAWGALLAAALLAVLPKWDRLVSGVDAVADPSSWPYMIGTFIALKLWHELGHGVVCKRFGGQVPEMGAMILVLLPSPYVDASSAWSFASKWQRIAVGAGGMLFELAAAAVCAFVWLNTPSGSMANQLAFYVMLTSSVSTVLFNGNPLMRFDGYYILSDLLEIPNLNQRSTQVIKNLLLKHVYRLPNLRPVTQQASEWWIMLGFGLAAMVYRLLVFFGILLWLTGELFGLGIILAAWSFAAWFIVPVGMFINWLASSPQLLDRRARAVLTSLGLVGGAALLVGAVPMPDWRRAQGVVESRTRVGVFAGADGTIDPSTVRAGQAVRKGDVLAVIVSPELGAMIDQARAEEAELQAKLRDARAGEEPAAVAVVARQLQAVRATLADLLTRRDELVVTAPIDGVVVSGDPARMGGMTVKRGQALCELLRPDDLRIHALMDQSDVNWLFARAGDAPPAPDAPERPLPPGIDAGVRLATDTGTTIAAASVSVLPSGQRRIPHPALSFAGGGPVEPETEQSQGRAAKTRRFSVYIDPAPGELVRAGALPGGRAYVRFTLPPRPLAAQVFDRLSKVLHGRVNL